MEDDALTRGANAGPGSFRSLFKEHSAQLKRLLLRVGVPLAEVDDALQDTFIVRLTKKEDVNPAAERYYLMATALRVAANRRRGRRRQDLAYARYLNDPGTDGHAGDLDEHGDRARAHDLVSETLGLLPRDLRDVLMMVEIDELSVSAIASQLGLPVGTMASRLRRARRAFETRLTEGGEPDSDDSAVIFHWWSTREEQVALEAVLGLHRRGRPRTHVIGVHGGGVISAKSQLNTRMLWNQPPDIFQANAGLDLLDWVVGLGKRDGGKLRSIADVMGEDGWTDAFPRELIEAVSLGGEPYAVPLNIHRTNNLFYHRRIFEECGLAPPSTVDEFFEVASRLKGRGIVPLAVGSRQPWPVTLLAFENLMVAVAGAKYYKEFFSGARSPADPQLRETLDLLKRVLSVANDDAPLLTWNEAVDRMTSGSAGMNIMGDWARGYMSAHDRRLSAASGGDHATLGPDAFGQVPTFGTEGVFVFTSDVFAIPTAAKNPGEAGEVLRTFGSREGQVAFSMNKGSIPARLDADPSGFDESARATMSAFQREVRVPTLTSLVPRVFSLALDAAMGSFMVTRDVEEIMRVIKGHYPELAG